MTISTTQNSVTISGNGATSVFGFSFVAGAAINIVVIFTDASGNETTLLTSQYTLFLNPAAANAIWGVGGTVTYPLSGSPIPAGTTLTIERIVPLTQTTSISNQGDFYAQAVEQALDILCMQIQQIGAVPLRSIQAPPVDLNPQMVLPPAAQRAGLFVGFDSSGNVLVGTPSGGGTIISAAMVPVVGASTLSLARTAMGVPGLTDNNSFSGTNGFSGTVTLVTAAHNEAEASLAGAGTINIGAAAGNYLLITGSGATITAFDTVQAGTERELEFAAANTLTHNATSLILPGGANIPTAAGDVASFRSEGSGHWRCTKYTPASGKVLPAALASAAQALAGTDATLALTAAAMAGNKTLAMSGFYKLPGGLIINWGQVALTGSGTNTFTYATAFPNTVFAVLATGWGGTGLTGVNINGTPSLSAAVILNTSASSQTAYCFAIGN